jgi:hypothetical protein
VRGRVVAEVESDNVPVRVPVVAGEKVTCRVQLEDGARVLPEVGQEPREAE